MKRTFFFPTDRDVAVIKKLRMYFGQNANIQQGFIRLEKPLTSTSVDETFTFGAGQQSGVKRPLERFLSTNDIFVALHLGVFVQKEIDGLDGNNGNAVNYPYPDLETFNTAVAGTSQSEANCLESIYNGTISLKSNTYEVVDRLSLQQYRATPETQYYAGSTTAGDVIPAQQASLGQVGAGFCPLHTVPVFEGKKRNELIFQHAPGSDVAQIEGTSSKNVLVFQMLGYLVRNASEAATIAELAKNGTLM